MSTWEFDAPTFVDFGNNAHEESYGAEDYFNYDHENQASLDFQAGDKQGGLTKDVRDEKCSIVRQTFEKSSDINSNDVLPEAHSVLPESNHKLMNNGNVEIKLDPSISDKSQNDRQPIDSLEEDNLSDGPEKEQGMQQTTRVAGDSVCETNVPVSVNQDVSQMQPADSLEEDNISDDPGEKMEENVPVPVEQDASETQPPDSLEEDNISNDPGEKMEENGPLPVNEVASETRPADSLEEEDVSDEAEEQMEENEGVNVPVPVDEDASKTQPVDSLEEDNVSDEPDEKMEESQPESPVLETTAAVSIEENARIGNAEPAEAMDQSENAASPGPSSAVPSNLITPSRAAAWMNAPRQNLRRQLATTRQAKDPRRRSKQLERAREIREERTRRSARINAIPAQEPPKKKQKKKEAVVRLVEPHTPTVLKHTRSQSMTKIKSTQERELEEIEMLKHQAKERMKEARRSMKKALKEPQRAPETPNSHKCTRAKEFKFLTDERIKSMHPMETRSQQTPGVDFAKGLRQHPPSPKKLKPTVVKPFHFSKSRKRAIEAGLDGASTSKPYPFAPMAKAVVDFHGKTRPRTATAAEDRKGPLKATRMLTTAKTPNLESTKRVRKLTVTSAKEIEDKEVEEMKSYHFRARPADRKILDHPHKLPEAKRVSGTKAIGFNLEMEKRIQDKPKAEKEDSPVKKFKANPVPKEVVMGEHLKSVVSAPNTVPQSPAFRLKNRMELHQKNKENVEMQRAIAEKEELEAAARRRRNLIGVGVKKVNPKKPVQVAPFSFDTRDKESLAKKEKKIQEIKEAERAAASAFKAQPLRDFDNPQEALPEKHVRPQTKAEPFHLLSDERGAVRAAKWREEVEGEMKKLKEMSEFKANTDYVNVIHSEPFAPHAVGKHTTRFREFSLHTNERASQRNEFDTRQKDREARALEANERVAQERELEEEKTAAEMRKNAVHKAAAIRKYKPVVVERSTKQLTQAQSPQFSDRFYK